MRRRRRFFKNYSTETSNILSGMAAVGAPPAPAFVEAAIDKFVRNSKADGSWSYYREFHLGYIHHIQAAKVCFINPIDRGYDLTEINTPLFTPFQGYWNDAAHGFYRGQVGFQSLPGVLQDNIHLGGYWLGGTLSTNDAIGNAYNSASNTCYLNRNTGQSMSGRCNDSSAGTIGTNDSLLGHRAFSRRADASPSLIKVGWTDGVSATLARTSTGIRNDGLQILAEDIAQTIALAHVGIGDTGAGDVPINLMYINQRQLLRDLGVAV